MIAKGMAALQAILEVKAKNLNAAFSDFSSVVFQYLNKILQKPQSKGLTFKCSVSI